MSDAYQRTVSTSQFFCVLGSILTWSYTGVPEVCIVSARLYMTAWRRQGRFSSIFTFIAWRCWYSDTIGWLWLWHGRRLTDKAVHTIWHGYIAWSDTVFLPERHLLFSTFQLIDQSKSSHVSNSKLARYSPRRSLICVNL